MKDETPKLLGCLGTPNLNRAFFPTFDTFLEFRPFFTKVFLMNNLDVANEGPSSIKLQKGPTHLEDGIDRVLMGQLKGKE